MDVKTKRRLSTEGKGLLASAIGGGAAGGAAAAPAVPAAESKAPAAPARGQDTPHSKAVKTGENPNRRN